MSAVHVETGPAITIDPIEVRLDLIRGDIVIQFAIVAKLEELAQIYLSMRADADLIGAIRDARKRMVTICALARKLDQERADAAIAAEAATEFRAQRDRRRA